MTLRPTTISEVQAAVRGHRSVLPHGGRTKPALCRAAGDGVAMLDMTGLSGVLEYEPGEFTVTALAGTRLHHLRTLLADHGQHLPFDPPFVECGATLGGAAASGLSGSSRLRCGGVRDFIIGVRFVDGTGEVIRGGGKVVKNAAGFDLPKLMVGSAGRLGVLTELTFKVFPRPRHSLTLRLTCPDLRAAVETMCRLTTGPHDLEAIDLEPPRTLVVRLTGDPEALAARAKQVAPEAQPLPDGGAYWRDVGEFTWAPEPRSLVKVPLTPQRLARLDGRLESLGAQRRYSVAGNVAWIACDRVGTLDAELAALDLPGLVLRGDVDHPLLGVDHTGSFIHRVKRALDPDDRFVPFRAPAKG